MKHTIAALLLLSLSTANATKLSLRRPSLDGSNNDDTSTRSLATSQAHFACGNPPVAYCVKDRSTCEDDLTCRCRRGFSGPNCEPEDECKAAISPCPSEGSFCVNDEAPRFYRCDCLPGRVAVLPSQADVTDPVPASWRPVACIKEEPVDQSPAPTPVSVPVLPIAVDPTPAPTVNGVCTISADCKGANFECKASKCVCQEGHFQVGPNCQLENECHNDALNDCHKYATCTNNQARPGFSCSCSDGFVDRFPGLNKTGTVCMQQNECLTGTHDCESKNKTCVDRSPPSKWECVDPTPAPTMRPTPSPTAPRPIAAAKPLFSLTDRGGSCTCTWTNPCGSCEGDCFMDDACAGSLVCSNSNNPSPQECSGPRVNGYFYCGKPDN